MRLFCLFILLSVSAAAQHAVPSYRAARTVDPIRIDGELTEFSWQIAPDVGRFRRIRALDDPSAAPTKAAILWDDRNLYIAFVCRDSEAWGTLFERDAFLWEQEVVEVFLDPDGDGRDYPELEVSPHNVVVDLLIPAPNRKDPEVTVRWDIEGLKTAVGKRAAGWTVEIAIPWAALGEAGVSGAPVEGDRWRIGLYRIERPGGAPAGAKLAEARKKLESASGAERARIEAEIEQLRRDHQFLAWSPTKKSFHEPERFGIVEFTLNP